MRRLSSLFGALGFGWQVLAQGSSSCENYGTQNGTACSCPPGFGGPTCSEPACGGDIFEGTSRHLASGNATVLANITASACTCETGWGGFGCNVCQSAAACQAAFTSIGGSGSSSADGLTSGLTGENSTLVCSTGSQVSAAGQMSCSVINPTLQALFPAQANLNILRTLQPALTPLPNVTGFGDAGSVYAQLWYDGVEQFYCSAGACTQNSASDNSTNWQCSGLQCTCRTNATLCGGGGAVDLTQTIDGLNGDLTISCAAPSNDSAVSCGFQQSVLNSLFGSSGLSLSDCTFGECVAQGVIDAASGFSSSTTGDTRKSLSGGVIAGLAVVGALVALALAFLILGFVMQRRARRGWGKDASDSYGGIAITWQDVSYTVPGANSRSFLARRTTKANSANGYTDEKTILDCVSGHVAPGQMMAILGPSGAGKTTLVEILAGKHKSGRVSGTVSPSAGGTTRIAFVPQEDVLPAALTVREALSFAAALRLPESVPPHTRAARVDEVIALLGLERVASARIGSHAARGVSGGERRRVSIGLELVGRPDALVLDEPTSGLDSVSAARVADALRAIARDPAHPTAVIASIHQPSSKLYHAFDRVVVLAHGRALYSGAGGLAPAAHFTALGVGAPPEGYNVAEHLLDVASAPPPALFSAMPTDAPGSPDQDVLEKGTVIGNGSVEAADVSTRSGRSRYATTFLTQFEVLAGREWKMLRRDKTLFLMHVGVACVLGVFCGGLYFNTGITIAGFQSRVGCLFFLGALVAFSSLSALYNLIEARPLFVRERSNMYYSPTAWLLARLIFDVVPLRLVPTIIVSSITYWMAGLADDAAHFFKFLFILVLYSLAMTLFNFLLASVLANGGVAVLLSALSALYQMTFAGFFVHLNSIPPVLRWLQWLCPLKYCLEALSVNEVGAGLMIQDTLQGVPVDVSAAVIMQLLFGFGANNYYRDVLVLFAFVAGFGAGVIGVVWLTVRERR
ncbi:hypothetical protein M0805_003637 [Coniferiporia weirii]|nr:hypothetical protein M0805_003637 [Coniferiporia weirii]